MRASLLLLFVNAGGRQEPRRPRVVSPLAGIRLMRALAALRNYALLVFFLLLAGGVVLQPGQGGEQASRTVADDGGVYRAG